MDNCDAVLLAAYNITVSTTSKKLHENIHDFLLTTDYQQVKSKINTGGGAGFLGFNFNANFTQEDFNEWKTKAEKLKKSDFNEDLAFQFIQKSVNPDVIKAWLECKRLHAPNRNGLVLTVVDNGANIASTLSWNPQYEGDDAPIILDCIVSGAVVENPLLRGEKMHYNYTMFIQRQPFNAVQIVVNTNKGSLNHFIPAAEPAISWEETRPSLPESNNSNPMRQAAEETKRKLDLLFQSGEDF
jgi:hypothetical protein